MLTSTSNLVPHPVLAYDPIDETLEIPILSLSRTDRSMWPVTGVWLAIFLVALDRAPDRTTSNGRPNQVGVLGRSW